MNSQLAHVMFYLALAGVFFTMILIIIKERRNAGSKTGIKNTKSRKNVRPYIESESIYID